MIHPIALSHTTDSINMFLLVQVSSGLFNTTYAIPRATTIPADSTEHKVRRVSVLNSPCTFMSYSMEDT